MFGIFRYLLASMVAFSHLWFRQADWPGMYAVFGFFMLSGYLMTLVLDKTYDYNFCGLTKFLLNRVLRIYPLYWLICIVSLCLIYFMPEYCRLYNKVIVLPTNMADWLKNIFLVELIFNGKKPMLVPLAWSLYIEVFYYACMAIFLARWKNVTLVWFVLSAGYTVYIVWAGYGFEDRYFSISSASLPYSIGSVIYHFRAYFRRLSAWNVLPATALYVSNTAFAGYLWGDTRITGFYVSLLLCAYLVASLSLVDKARFPSWARRFDSFMGDLAYLIFLVHPFIAISAMWWMHSLYRESSGIFYLSVLTVSTLVAWVIHVLLEERINRLRQKVRNLCSGLALPGNQGLQLPQEQIARTQNKRNGA